MNKKKNLAILLEFGFHEIKKYIHSGFLECLAGEFSVYWIALDKGSGEFHKYFADTGHPLRYLKDSEINTPLLKVENYNKAVRKSWLIKNDMGGFHNHLRVESKSIKTWVLGNQFVKDIFENITLNAVYGHYYNECFAEIFDQFSIDSLLITGASSGFAKGGVVTAQKRNISVNYLVNSWKDLYVNNFVPFRNLSNIFVWSERMKSDYLKHMPYLKERSFVVSGNPTFDSLLRSETKNDRSFYSEKYNIPLNSKWLLYTMMPVGLAKDELETIIYTANNILKYFSKEEYTIIVRKNPTHEVGDFKEVSLPENLIIADHFCSFDKKNDMIIQSREGEQEWLDLVHHSIANLSVPSTVTLEFLTLGKNVFNISYNSKGEIDERIFQFFDAGFYRPLFDRKDVANIKNIEELINSLKTLRSENESRNLSRLTAAEIIVQHLAKN